MEILCDIVKENGSGLHFQPISTSTTMNNRAPMKLVNKMEQNFSKHTTNQISNLGNLHCEKQTTINILDLSFSGISLKLLSSTSVNYQISKPDNIQATQ